MDKRITETFNKLSDLAPGQSFTISGFDNADNTTKRIQEMGLWKGRSGTVLQSNKSMIFVKIDGARIGMNKSVAIKIQVRPL